MEVMAAFEHAAIAIAEMNSLRPDVVLVNSTLPDMPGFEACVRLMDATPPPRVIMMCLSMTDAEIFAGRMAGAAGCLTIDGAVEDLVRTVRANGRGEMFHIRSVSESALRFAQYRPMTHDPSEPTTGTRRDFLRRRWPPLLLAIPGLVVDELVAVRLWDNLYPGLPSSPPSGPLPPPMTEAQK